MVPAADGEQPGRRESAVTDQGKRVITFDDGDDGEKPPNPFIPIASDWPEEPS